MKRLVCLGLLLAFGTSPAAWGGAKEKVEQVLQQITAANRAFEEAVRKGDVEGIASAYTPEAIALAPDAPMARGRESIEQLWGSAIRDGLKTIRLETLDLEVAGDTAYEVGRAILGLEPKGGAPTTAVVKYVVVWKKVKGQWRLHRDIWNART
jgi:uncharacterized protein (TIGR02246 family)